jgi:hypothetical protein
MAEISTWTFAADGNGAAVGDGNAVRVALDFLHADAVQVCHGVRLALEVAVTNAVHLAHAAAPVHRLHCGQIERHR